MSLARTDQLIHHGAVGPQKDQTMLTQTKAPLGTYADAAQKEREFIRTFETLERTRGQQRYADTIAALGVESWLYDQDTLGAGLAAQSA